MGAEDKASNKIDDVGGKAKEALGKVTGDKDTENEGKVDQAKSSLKDAGEKIKEGPRQSAGPLNPLTPRAGTDWVSAGHHAIRESGCGRVLFVSERLLALH
jgi:uncharacterized protein YjbJ (UPF0337 family)